MKEVPKAEKNAKEEKYIEGGCRSTFKEIVVKQSTFFSADFMLILILKMKRVVKREVKFLCLSIVQIFLMMLLSK